MPRALQRTLELDGALGELTIKHHELTHLLKALEALGETHDATIQSILHLRVVLLLVVSIYILKLLFAHYFF